MGRFDMGKRVWITDPDLGFPGLILPLVHPPELVCHAKYEPVLVLSVGLALVGAVRQLCTYIQTSANSLIAVDLDSNRTFDPGHLPHKHFQPYTDPPHISPV